MATSGFIELMVVADSKDISRALAFHKCLIRTDQVVNVRDISTAEGLRGNPQTEVTLAEPCDWENDSDQVVRGLRTLCVREPYAEVAAMVREGSAVPVPA